MQTTFKLYAKLVRVRSVAVYFGLVRQIQSIALATPTFTKTINIGCGCSRIIGLMTGRGGTYCSAYEGLATVTCDIQIAITKAVLLVRQVRLLPDPFLN